MCLVFTCMLRMLRCFQSLVSTQTFQRALTASGDGCMEIKRVPLQWRNQFWQSLEEGTGKRCLECGPVCDFVERALGQCCLLQTVLPVKGSVAC